MLIRCGVAGPDWDSDVVLGGCGHHQPAAGQTGRTAAQVWVCGTLSLAMLSFHSTLCCVSVFSYNRLRLPPDPSALRHAFSALKVVVLNGCQLTWPQVRSTVALIFTFVFQLRGNIHIKQYINLKFKERRI